MKLREPRNREKFMDAAMAADRLEHVAVELRRRIRPGDQSRWELKVWHWNESWNDPTRTFDLDRIITTESFHSGTAPNQHQNKMVVQPPDKEHE